MNFRYGRGKARGKYGAQRTNGFASKLESATFDLLKLREKLGEIKEIKCQQSVCLLPGPRSHRISWKVDFSFIEIATNELVYVEAKGMECATYKLKLKMWRADPPARLQIYKGDYRRPKLVEEIFLKAKEEGDEKG